MARKATNTLYDLVHSLTGSEIRYFKIYHKNDKGENLLVALFDSILEQEEFDDDALYDSLKDKFPLRVNFNVKKNHLQESILRVMRIFHFNDSDINTLIRNEINDIDFLIRKRQTHEALKAVVKTKALAYRYERYKFVYELINYEMMFPAIGREPQEVPDHIKNLNGEASSIISLLKDELGLEEIYTQIWRCIYPDTKQTTKQIVNTLERLLKYDVLTKEFIEKSVSARSALFVIKEQLQELKERKNQTAEKGGKYLKNIVAFLHELETENKLFILESRELHYGVFLGRLFSLIDASDITLRMLKEMQSILGQSKFTNELFLKWQNAAGYWLALLLSYQEGNLKAFEAAVNKFDLFVRKNEKLLDGISIELPYMALGANYLMHNNFKKAKATFTRLLALTKKTPKESATAIGYSLLNLLLIATEENDEVAIDKRTVELNEFLSSQTDYGPVPGIIVSYAEMITQAKRKTSKDVIYQGIYSQLKEAENDEDSKSLFFRFYYPGWFESKLTGKPFSKIVAERAQLDTPLGKL